MLLDVVGKHLKGVRNTLSIAKYCGNMRDYVKVNVKEFTKN